MIQWPGSWSTRQTARCDERSASTQPTPAKTRATRPIAVTSPRPTWRAVSVTQGRLLDRYVLMVPSKPP